LVIEEATKAAFERYKAMFLTKNVKAINYAHLASNEIRPAMWLSHAHWMTDECLSKMKRHEFSVDKLSRWLGFIQAVIIINGYSSIEAERNITRPWFRGTQ